MRPIEGWPEYMAGEDGTIYRVMTRGRKPQDPSPVKPWIGSSGYPQIYMTRKGMKITRMVHRIIAEAWLECTGPEVNHKNGIKTDNRLSNLEWCDRAYNVRHAQENGRYRLAKKNLTCEQEYEVFQLNKDGHSITLLSKRFNVSVNKITKAIVKYCR